LTPIQAKYQTLTDDDIRAILQKWTQKAREIATLKIERIKDKVGFTL
jgi:hypothetical protein